MPVCSIVGYFGWWWDGSRSFFFLGAFTYVIDRGGLGTIKILGGVQKGLDIDYVIFEWSL